MPPSERSIWTWRMRLARRSGMGSRSRLITSAPPATRRPINSRPMTPAPPVTTILCGMCNLLRSDLAHRRDDPLAALAVNQSACGLGETAAQRRVLDHGLDRFCELLRRAVTVISDIEAALVIGEPAREH